MIKLYLTVAHESPHSGPKRCYEREVSWTCVPPDDYTIFVGRDEDGSGSSINASVSGTDFSTDGVCVEAVIDRCLEEYHEICASVERDGFKLVHEFK